ncbi:MAG: hypothetical protein OXS33_06850 [bacterium]|nr:hypothetical protein [bacterium]
MSSQGGYIQTVLGPIAPEEAGVSLIHEHVLLDLTKGITGVAQYKTGAKKYVPIMRRAEAGWEPGQEGPGTAATWGAKWGQPVTLENLNDRQKHWVYYGDQKLDSIDDAIYEFDQFRRVGGSTIVDQTTRGMGRDPLGLVEISRATGVNVVMATGWYLADYHPDDMDELSEEKLVELMVQDIEVGVAGGVKAGIIGEVGMDHPMHPNEEKSLRASAKAAVATGVALSVHPGFNPASPFDIVRVVDEAGGDLSRTVIDHCDSRFNTSAGTNVFDSGPLLELAKTGVYLAFDTFGWEGSFRQRSPVDQPNDAIRLNWLKTVADAGYPDRVLVSSDIALKHWLRRYGGHGWRHLPETVRNLMRYKGFPEELIHQIFVDNPREVLTKS